MPLSTGRDTASALFTFLGLYAGVFLVYWLALHLLLYLSRPRCDLGLILRFALLFLYVLFYAIFVWEWIIVRSRNGFAPPAESFLRPVVQSLSQFDDEMAKEPTAE